MVLFEAEVLMYGQAEGVGLIGAAIILWSGGQPEPCQNAETTYRTLPICLYTPPCQQGRWKYGTVIDS